MARQATQWREYQILVLIKLCAAYFGKLEALLTLRIEVEGFYARCFALKQQKVCSALDKLDEQMDEWDLADTREYVRSTMLTISRMRTSPEVQKKKAEAQRLKASISRMESTYERKKEQLAVAKVEHKQRAQRIAQWLKGVMGEFCAAKGNIRLTAGYFIAPDVQRNFDAFLLDQRVEVGQIVANWLRFLCECDKAAKQVLFKDVVIFMERLINTFAKLYQLETALQREYVMRFAYVAVLGLDEVDAILAAIAATEQGRMEYALLAGDADYTLFAHFLRLKYKL